MYSASYQTNFEFYILCIICFPISNKNTILSVKVALSLAGESFSDFKSMSVHPSVNVSATSQSNLFESVKLLCLYLILFSDHVLSVIEP